MTTFRFVLLIVVCSVCVVTTAPRSPVALGADEKNRVADLESRVASLERVIRNLDRAPEITILRSKVAELERRQRDTRSGSTNNRQPSGDVSKVTRENAALRTSINTLAAKVTTGEQTATQLRREISSLRQKVSTLQSTVDRLRR